MKSNVTFSIGSIALVEKINGRYHLFNFLFEKIDGKAKNLKETAKLLVTNRLDKCASIRQLPNLYPAEFYQELGFPKTPAERSTYRNLERIGENFALLLLSAPLDVVHILKNRMAYDSQTVRHGHHFSGARIWPAAAGRAAGDTTNVQE